jgi:CubicO group peptidase (beta-lactamase class C family)
MAIRIFRRSAGKQRGDELAKKDRIVAQSGGAARKQLYMRSVLLLLVCTAIASCASAADVPSKQIDQLFAAYDRPHSPGCSVGVIRDGRFVFQKSYGEASLELGAPLTGQSIFYLASVSKQFTAASVVLAAEQGFLSLDDDVRRYIPELPDYGHPVTLSEMLHHTAGFRDFLALVYLSGRNIADLSSAADILKLITRQKALNNVPGDEFVYSNSNYFLLGVVVERATKMSLAAFAAQNMFQPLGMASTRYYDDNSTVVPGRVAAYDQGKHGSFLVDWSTIFDIVGSGGLLSNVDDLLRWDNNFYANKLGKGTLIKELENRGTLNNGNRINYGLGLSLGNYRGLSIVEHAGATFGYRSEFLRFPEQRFSVLCLCNLASVDVVALSRRIADLYLAKQLQSQTTISSPPGGFPDPTPFAGKYLDPRTHMIYTFTVTNRNLMAWGSVLRRIAANQYYDLSTNIITFENSHGVMAVTLDLEGERYFSGSRLQEMHLTESDLRAFAGKYRSEELGASYELSLERGDLMLTILDKPPLKLNAVAPNEFEAGDLGTLVFHPGAHQDVAGLTLFSQAARGIEFQKIRP